MEDCLRVSDQQYHEMIKVLDYIVRNTTSEYEKNHFLSGLFSKMGQTEAPLNRIPDILKYQEELDYFHREGYFHIKELSLPQDNTSTVAILGANKIIYLLKNLSLSESLQDVCNLLLEQFPQDFRDSHQLESFYIRTADPEARIIKPSGDITFDRIGFTPHEVYGLAGQPDCQRLMRFFHSVYDHPEVFTGSREILKSSVSPGSPAYGLMQERMQLITQGRQIEDKSQGIEIKKSILSNMEDGGKKEKYKEVYREDKKELAESQERYAKSRAAFLERLKQANRSRETAKDPQEATRKVQPPNK
jgi:hypothetical protein